IALVNEMKMVLDAMDIDIWEVIDAASTKPFGFTRFTPGPGMGGHCIPIDPFYLTWIARKAGLSTKFIELAGEINRSMPRYVVERTQFALNSVGRAVRGSRVLVLGLSYKPEVGIVSESPSIPLLQQFAELGAEIAYSDPFVPVAPDVEGMPEAVRGLRSIDLDAATVASFDVVVLSTSHRAFDTEMIAAAAPLMVDTRNRFASLLEGSERYFKA
ncbi:MAG: UDP binding domain-containing protein, partial [Planctomycetota bacterium]